MPDLVRNPTLLDQPLIDTVEGGGWPGLANWVRVLLLVVGLQVIWQLNSRFWLDETLTYWTTNQGLNEIVQRCIMWPNSILYSSLFYGMRLLGATSPWVYRLPSLLAVLVSGFVLFRMVRRIFGIHIAWLAIATFAALRPVQFAAADARPYALGLAAAVLSTDILLRFLDRPSYKLAVLYGFTSALVLHFHLLFGAALLFQFIYIAYKWYCGLRIPIRYLAAGLAVLLLIAFPLVAELSLLSKNPAQHSFTDSPHPNNLVEMFVPAYPTIALLSALTVAALTASRVNLKWTNDDASHWVLVALWTLTPPAVLFALSILSTAHVFIPRYFLPYAPGLAICFALAVGLVKSPAVGRTFLLILILTSAQQFRHLSTLRHTSDLGDWGAAVALVNQETPKGEPVLVRSQYVESDSVSLDPVIDNPAFSQLAFYPIKTRVIPLPVNFREPQRALLDEVSRTTLEPARRFLFVAYTNTPGSSEPFFYYLRGRLGPSWQVRTLGVFDGVVVTEFQMSGS